MGRTAVLIVSILSIISTIVARSLTSATPFPLFIGAWALAMILWVVIIALVWGDARARKKSLAFGGLTLILGGLGGLIYFFASKDKD